MSTWYAQLSATSFFSVSSGTTSNQWNAATNGSGAWLDLSTNYTADTFNSNGKTTIAIDANVTAAELTSAAAAGTWTINTTGVTITANLTAGTTSTFVMNSGTPTVSIIGNLTAGSGSNDICVDLAVSGALNVTGNVTAGAASACHGINVSAGAPTINITGTVTGGGNVGAYGVALGSVTGGTVLSVTGSIVASTGNAVAATGAGSVSISVTSGNIVDTATVNAFMIRNGTFLFTPNATNYYRIRTTGSSTVDLYSDVPAIANVRDNDTARGVTGEIVSRTLSAANDTVAAGYYAATTLSAVDTDLAAANIATGTTIFGFAGTAAGGGGGGAGAWAHRMIAGGF